jgi:hypothetical protein
LDGLTLAKNIREYDLFRKESFNKNSKKNLNRFNATIERTRVNGKFIKSESKIKKP